MQRDATRWLGVLMLALCASLPADAATLVNGGTVSGAIGMAGGLDSHVFAANAGENVWLRIVDTGNSDFQPKMTVYGPGGTLIGSDYDSDVGKLEFTIASSGTHTVVVSDAVGTHTGTYTLYHVRVPGANEGGQLINGGAGAGTIDLGDLDSYTFTANAGESIWMRIANTGSSVFQPKVTLYDPAGARVASGYSSQVGDVTYTPLISGVHTVVVSDTVGTHAGDYKLNLAIAPRASEGGTLFDGASKVDAIDLGDLDSYTFSANGGESIQIRISDTSASVFFPKITLYGPGGGYLTSVRGDIEATLSRQLTQAGNYTVVVSDSGNGNAQSGSYSIVLTGAGGSEPDTSGDVPLPLWALALLAGLLGEGLRRGHRLPG